MARRALFFDEIDRWVATVAHQTHSVRLCSCRVRASAPPKRIVGWLADAVSRMEEPESVRQPEWESLRGKNLRTHGFAIRRRFGRNVSQRYVALLDRLVAVGIRLGSIVGWARAGHRSWDGQQASKTSWLQEHPATYVCFSATSCAAECASSPRSIGRVGPSQDR